ncbi:hypothetical protein HPB52_004890 [Rhipicephalus sanguineus]|uniref:Uncharacterized protein n=1 Tax=Rhipicephalus sanguineus TaxID=34632 RepID=A0A9D4SRZ5_RHISA|nr:hypothetical protein HPB52_004890 [Rhipicephalus sanguineus]
MCESSKASYCVVSPGATTSAVYRNNPLVNFMVYGAVVLGLLAIFTLAVMFAYAMAGRNSWRGREDRTEDDLGVYRPRLTDHPGLRRRASIVAPSPNKASESHLPRGSNDEDHRAA